MCALRASSQPAVAPVEVVYSLEPAWWGRGLATRAAAAVLGYALGPVGLPAVAGAVDDGNHRSAAVLRRLGMAPVAGADTRGPLGTIHWSVRDRDRQDGAGQPASTPSAVSASISPSLEPGLDQHRPGVLAHRRRGAAGCRRRRR